MGSKTRDYDLIDAFAADEGTVFLTGMQALARLPVEQIRSDRAHGLNTAAFASGYPGSPLAGLDGAFARAAKLAPDLPIVLRPAVNEELAVAAVMGSQLASTRPDRLYDGVVGFWYGKAPGLDRSSDALRHAVFAGTSSKGGAVAIVGDDPAAKSSTLPSSSDATLMDLHLPVLYPADVAEAVELGRHAITLSRATGLWVGLKIVTSVADASGSVELNTYGHDPVIPMIDGEPYECVPDALLLGAHSLQIEEELRGIRTELAIAYGELNNLNRVVVDSERAWLGIIATGFTHAELMEALRRLGLNEKAISTAGVRILEMKMPVPFDPAVVRRFAKGLEEVMVVEEMNPTLERAVKDALYGTPDQPFVTGKADRDGRPQFRGHGPLDADQMVAPLRAALAGRVDMEPPQRDPDQADRERILIPLTANRAPAFCSGCPHNHSTRVPEGTMVGAGIGCHTMALLSDDDRVGDIACITAMGGEGAPWIGMSEFVGTGHFTQNLGDGTYFHSGRLAIEAAVAAGVNITYKLLHNGSVAMTGGQPPPGQQSLPSIVQGLLLEGVSQVMVTSDDVERSSQGLPRGVEVWHRNRIIEAQERLAEVPGVTVLIHDQACAAQLRRERHRGRAPAADLLVMINERVCEGCGDCAEKSSCLSVQPVATEFGPKTTIDQGSCNMDYSCLEGDCPAFLTIRLPRSGVRGWLSKTLSRITGRSGRSGVGSTPGPTGATNGPAGATHGSAGAVPEITGAASDPPPVSELPQPEHSAAEARVRLAGIGGTGVVTVAQVLGTAATLDGHGVRGLDMTGLSQKAGPVVSDLHIGGSAGEFPSGHVGEAQADLLIALDTATAAADGPLSACDPERTHVVGSTSLTPTPEEVHHPHLRDSEDAARLRIEQRCVTGAHWADAARVADNLVGNPATANMVVAGMAVQSGRLPVTVQSVLRAIELNGVAVEANKRALLWGCWWVADPARVPLSVERDEPAPDLPAELADRIAVISGAAEAQPLGADLERVLSIRCRELIEYQDRALAVVYLDWVERTATVERAVLAASSEAEPGGGLQLSGAVIHELFHVMAYKDEYEVARLLLSGPEVPGSVGDGLALGGPGATVAWRLHPPLLRSLGLSHKIELGMWARPVMGALRRMKWLRGNPWDPFGWHRVRRAERKLVRTFTAALVEVLAGLEPHNLGAAVELIRLSEKVRGYEDIKLARISEYEEALRAALAGFRSAGANRPPGNQIR